MVTVPPLRLDQDFRARSGDGKAAEIEEEQVRRGIDAAQRAIKRERRQRERRLETLRQHDLENIAGGDVLLGAQHHALEFVRRGVRSRRDVRAARQSISGRAADLSSGRSSASTTADRRSTARASAALALTPACGRTGVTTVMVSSTASKTITKVGRTRIASGMPIGSGPGRGNSSISRTMS